MKILGSLSFLLVASTVSYAAIEHDLQSLQQHLTALESALTGKAPAGGGVVPKKTLEDLRNTLIADFNNFNIEAEQFSNSIAKNDQEAVTKHNENLVNLLNNIGTDLENLDNYDKPVTQKNARIIVGTLKTWHNGLKKFNEELTSVPLDLNFFVTASSLANDRIIKLFDTSIVDWDNRSKGKTVKPSGGGVQPPLPPIVPGKSALKAPVTENTDLNHILSAMVDDFNQLQENMDSFENLLHRFSKFIHGNKIARGNELPIFNELVDSLQPLGPLVESLHAKLSAVHLYKDQITKYEGAKAIYSVVDDIKRQIDIFVGGIEEYRMKNFDLMNSIIIYKASEEQNLAGHFLNLITHNTAILQMEMTKHGKMLPTGHKDTFADDLDKALRLWGHKMKTLQPK